MHRTSAALGCLSLAALSTLPVPGQAAVPQASVYPDRIEVKLVEGCGAILTGTQLLSRTGIDLREVGALFDRGSARHLIDVPMHILDRWHEESAERIPTDRRGPGHLGLWFLIQTDTDEEAQRLLSDLRIHPLVETAYLQMVPYLPRETASEANPVATTPRLNDLQGYMGPAPEGLDMHFAHGVIGGRGRGVKLNHVEADWQLDHEDASQVSAAAMLVPPTENGSWEARNHGLAGAGLIAADRNGYGIDGMADQVRVRILSWSNPRGVSNAIAQALLHSDEGDVLMIVVQFLLGQRGPFDFVPAEFLQSNFDAILTSTSLGRHFVQNAGNGASDLDDPRYFRRFDLGFRDSGSIMVGATNGSATERASFSNYGSRITVNGWGLGVVTVGFGDLFWGGDLRRAYTEKYSGTSSAAPMAAATVAALVGAAKQQLERSLTVDEVRALLRRWGTPVTGNIGLRPDLRAMLAALGIPDGLQVDGSSISPGDDRGLRMTGPADGSMILFASFALGSTNLGLNRNVHLSFDSLVHVGAFPLTGGTAVYQLEIPNARALRGTDVFFQGISTDTMGSLRVSNSVQLTIR